MTAELAPGNASDSTTVDESEGSAGRAQWNQNLTLHLFGDLAEVGRDKDAALPSVVLTVMRQGFTKPSPVARGSVGLEEILNPVTGAALQGGAEGGGVPLTLSLNPLDSKSRLPKLRIEMAFREAKTPQAAPLTGAAGGVLRVHVMRARQLLLVDGDEQDPQVIGSLVQGDPPVNVTAAGRFETTASENTGRRALWNETFDVIIPADAAAAAPRLVLDVRDKEWFSDKPIGSVSIDLAAAFAAGRNPDRKAKKSSAGDGKHADDGGGSSEGESDEDELPSGGDDASGVLVDWFRVTPHEKVADSLRAEVAKRTKTSRGKTRGRGAAGATGPSAEEYLAEFGAGQLRIGLVFMPSFGEPTAALLTPEACAGGVVHMLVVAARLAAAAVPAKKARRYKLSVEAGATPVEAKARKARAKKQRAIVRAREKAKRRAKGRPLPPGTK